MLAELGTVVHQLDTLLLSIKSHNKTQEERAAMLQEAFTNTDKCKHSFGVFVCTMLLESDPKYLEENVEVMLVQVASIHDKFKSIARDATRDLQQAQRALARCYQRTSDPLFCLLGKALEIHPLTVR